MNKNNNSFFTKERRGNCHIYRWTPELRREGREEDRLHRNAAAAVGFEPGITGS